MTTIVSPPVPVRIYTSTPGATFNGSGHWTPQKDGTGKVLASEWAGLPLKEWRQWSNTNMEAVIKPILDAGGYNIYRHGSAGFGGITVGYSGAAIKPGGGEAYFHGGGHEDGSDNTVVKLDTERGTFSIAAYPSKVGVDGYTAEDDQIFALARQSALVDRINIIPYTRSSTGFASKIHMSFSTFQWVECVGPARYVTDPNEVVFPNGGKLLNLYSQRVRVVFEDSGGEISDIMPDGRPTSRHTYSGFVWVDNTKLMLAVRSNWWCNLNGTGWRRYPQPGSRVPQTLNKVGEMIWTMYDPATRKVYKGGCGGECHSTTPAYFFYGAMQAINVDTGATTEVNNIRAPSLIAAMLNPGDHYKTFTVAGRKIVHIEAWSQYTYVDYVGRQFMNTYDIDTQETRGFEITGNMTQLSNEGNPCIYHPGLSKVYYFDSRSPSLPCRSVSIVPTGTPIAGLYQAPQTLETFANAASLPVAGNPSHSPLIYTRLWLFGDVIVYCPYAGKDLWVARIA